MKPVTRGEGQAYTQVFAFLSHLVEPSSKPSGVLMPANVLADSTQRLSTQPTARSEAVTASDEERWAAWRARGAAHDRAVRRKVSIAAPILAVVVAILYFGLIR
jgi:hypothetical protein